MLPTGQPIKKKAFFKTYQPFVKVWKHNFAAVIGQKGVTKCLFVAGKLEANLGTQRLWHTSHTHTHTHTHTHARADWQELRMCFTPFQTLQTLWKQCGSVSLHMSCSYQPHTCRQNFSVSGFLIVQSTSLLIVANLLWEFRACIDKEYSKNAMPSYDVLHSTIGSRPLPLYHTISSPVFSWTPHSKRLHATCHSGTR